METFLRILIACHAAKRAEIAQLEGRIGLGVGSYRESFNRVYMDLVWAWEDYEYARRAGKRKVYLHHLNSH